MNVAKNSDSSSLRDMLPLHEQAAPSARIVGRQEVSVERLDTQGSEDHVAPEFADPHTAAMLQANGWFVRPEMLQA